MTEEEPTVQAELQQDDDDDLIQAFDAKKAKKGKKKKKKDKAKVAGQAAAASNEVCKYSSKILSKRALNLEGFNWDEGHTPYEYAFLLDRIETIMNEKQSQSAEEAKDQKGEVPLTKFISTKTSIVNFDVLCEQLEREKDHLLNFLKTEMDVEGNLGSEGNVLL